MIALEENLIKKKILIFSAILLSSLVVLYLYTSLQDKRCPPIVNHSEPLPDESDFILAAFMPPQGNMYEGYLHVSFNEYALWEIGEFGSETVNKAKSTVVFVIDQVAITAEIYIEYGPLIIRYNEDDEAIGLHGGHFVAIIPIDFIPHAITVGIRLGEVCTYEYIEIQ